MLSVVDNSVCCDGAFIFFNSLISFVFCFQVDMFPSIEAIFIREKLIQHAKEHRVAIVCNHILEHYSDCPKKSKPVPPQETAVSSSSTSPLQEVINWVVIRS